MHGTNFLASRQRRRRLDALVTAARPPSVPLSAPPSLSLLGRTRAAAWHPSSSSWVLPPPSCHCHVLGLAKLRYGSKKGGTAPTLRTAAVPQPSTPPPGLRACSAPLPSAHRGSALGRRRASALLVARRESGPSACSRENGGRKQRPRATWIFLLVDPTCQDFSAIIF